MYDPFAPPQLPQQGQMQPMNAPQTVGMVPGVQGSMGLNPGTGLAPGVMPIVPPSAAGGGPVMTPGGGGTGAPPQGPSQNNALGGFLQNFQQAPWMQNHPQFQGFWQQLQDWRGQRPDRQTYTGNDWRGAIQDWRQARPSWQSAMGGMPGMMGSQQMPTISQQGWRTGPLPGGSSTGTGF